MRTRVLCRLILVCGAAVALSHTATNAAALDAVEVPMLHRGPQPAVEVMVNGRGPFLFAIDTGASGAGRADAGLVTKLSLPAVGHAAGSAGTGGATRAMTVVSLETLSVGALVFKDLTLPSRDYNTAPTLPHIDGILGLDVFGGSLVTLDFVKERVRIEPGELPPADGISILDCDSARPVPSVALTVGATRIQADIDTGNVAAAFLLPARVAEALTFPTPPVVVGHARTITTDTELKQGVPNESLAIGGFAFPKPTVNFPAGSDRADVGSAALKSFVVTFDQAHHRLRLVRPPAAGTALDRD